MIMQTRISARAFRTLCASVALGFTLGGALQAQTTLLFDTAHLADVDAGSSLGYSIQAVRTSADTGEHQKIDGVIVLDAAAGSSETRRDVEAVLTRDGRSRTLPPFQGVQGNPVMIIFLEQVLQDLSEATGGSSNYLRNRLRDGLANGLTTTTQGTETALVMTPLAEDPNQQALGSYAGLEIRFVVDPEVAGMFLELSAQAGPAEDPIFLEKVTYDAEL